MSVNAIILFSIPCAFTAATLARVRLSQATQPLRLELAEKGERFLLDPEAPSAAKENVKSMLSHAFGMRIILLASLVAIPFIAVGLLFSKSLRDKFLDHACPGRMKAEFDAIQDLSMRIALANHPILFPIMAIWLVLWIAPTILIGTLIQGKPPEGLKPAAIFSFLEFGHNRPQAA